VFAVWILNRPSRGGCPITHGTLLIRCEWYRRMEELSIIGHHMTHYHQGEARRVGSSPTRAILGYVSLSPGTTPTPVVPMPQYLTFVFRPRVRLDPHQPGLQPPFARLRLIG